jgi:hypothetical protein
MYNEYSNFFACHKARNTKLQSDGLPTTSFPSLLTFRVMHTDIPPGTLFRGPGVTGVTFPSDHRARVTTMERPDIDQQLTNISHAIHKV